MNVLEIVERRFQEFGLPLVPSETIVPPDSSTLFVTAGMQLLKDCFAHPDHTGHGTVQSCLRTNDLDLIGDGQHLTFFKMLGSFGFGTFNYEMHVELWHSIVKDLNLAITHVNCHPESPHSSMWQQRGYEIREDKNCTWSDGVIGGFCSELFVGALEVGNLVNPLGHSVDVGFGLERLTQLVEHKARVDETTDFRQDMDPISRDHWRSLHALAQQNIKPGNKLRNYVCRRLLRRFIRRNPAFDEPCAFHQWLEPERTLLESSIRKASRYLKRNGPQSEHFWWDSFGLLPEDVLFLEPR